MKRNIRKAIARIDVVQDGNSISRGTGFLVTERLVLTALHVVANRRTDPPEMLPGTITLEFPGHTTQAQVYEQFFDRNADWALLKCHHPPNCPPLPLVTIEEDGLEWQTYGFPDANPRDGMVQAGKLENHDATLDGAHAFQLFSHQAAAGSGAPVRGLSGGPVIIEDAVVGLLRFALMREGQTVAGTLYACSIAALEDRAGEFLTIHQIKDWRAARDRQRRRLQWAGGIAAGLLGLLVVLFVMRPGDGAGDRPGPHETAGTLEPELDPNRVAVIPFRISGETTKQALAEGMDDALRDMLFSSRSELHVMSRASTMRYVQDGVPDLEAMHRELKAGSIVGGAFQQAADNLTLHASIIDPVTGEERSRLRVEGPVSDFAALQHRLGTEVAAELGADVRELEPVKDVQNLDAYSFVVQGDEFLDAAFEAGADMRKILQPPETDLAIEQYEKALETERAPATLAKLSQACSLKGLAGGSDDANRARALYMEAFELDEDTVEGYFARGLHSYWHKRDFEDAIWWFNLAVQRQQTGRHFYFAGLAARRLGRWETALGHFFSASELDPVDWMEPFEWGRTCVLIHRYKEADEAWGYTSDKEDTPQTHLMQALTLVCWTGDVEAAQDAVRSWILEHDVDDLLQALMVIEFRPVLRILDNGLLKTLNQVDTSRIEDGGSARYLLVKAEICRILGKADEQQQQLTRALIRLESEQGEKDSLDYYDVLALVHAGLGNSQPALDAAAAALSARPIHVDHHRGAVTAGLMAEVCMTLGEHDLALEQLDVLLMNPSYVSVEWVKQDPLFGPLRDDERLAALFAKAEGVQVSLDELPDGPNLIDRVKAYLKQNRAEN